MALGTQKPWQSDKLGRLIFVFSHYQLNDCHLVMCPILPHLVRLDLYRNPLHVEVASCTRAGSSCVPASARCQPLTWQKLRAGGLAGAQGGTGSSVCPRLCSSGKLICQSITSHCCFVDLSKSLCVCLRSVSACHPADM